MNDRDLKEKLIRIERTIAIYKKGEENPPIEEIKIEININVLKKIISVKNDDPLLIGGYILNKDQLTKINLYTKKKIIPDFNLFIYILEATGIYEWDR